MKTWQQLWEMRTGGYLVACTCGSTDLTRSGGPKVYGQQFYCARCGALRAVSAGMIKDSYYTRGSYIGGWL